MKRVGLSFFSISLLLSACVGSGVLTVTDAWARPAASGENGAIYFIIDNNTSAEDVLLSASTEVAESAEAHMTMIDGNDVISMKMQDVVPISAGQKLSFSPGELHIMLVGLKRDLRVGDTFNLTLEFKRSGIITLDVTVEDG